MSSKLPSQDQILDVVRLWCVNSGDQAHINAQTAIKPLVEAVVTGAIVLTRKKYLLHKGSLNDDNKSHQLNEAIINEILFGPEWSYISQDSVTALHTQYTSDESSYKQFITQVSTALAEELDAEKVKALRKRLKKSSTENDTSIEVEIEKLSKVKQTALTLHKMMMSFAKLKRSSSDVGGSSESLGADNINGEDSSSLGDGFVEQLIATTANKVKKDFTMDELRKIANSLTDVDPSPMKKRQKISVQSYNKSLQRRAAAEVEKRSDPENSNLKKKLKVDRTSTFDTLMQGWGGDLQLEFSLSRTLQGLKSSDDDVKAPPTQKRMGGSRKNSSSSSRIGSSRKGSFAEDINNDGSNTSNLMQKSMSRAYSSESTNDKSAEQLIGVKNQPGNSASVISAKKEEQSAINADEEPKASTHNVKTAKTMFAQNKTSSSVSNMKSMWEKRAATGLKIEAPVDENYFTSNDRSAMLKRTNDPIISRSSSNIKSSTTVVKEEAKLDNNSLEVGEATVQESVPLPKINEEENNEQFQYASQEDSMPNKTDYNKSLTSKKSSTQDLVVDGVAEDMADHLTTSKSNQDIGVAGDVADDLDDEDGGYSTSTTIDPELSNDQSATEESKTTQNNNEQIRVDEEKLVEKEVEKEDQAVDSATVVYDSVEKEEGEVDYTNREDAVDMRSKSQELSEVADEQEIRIQKSESFADVVAEQIATNQTGNISLDISAITQKDEEEDENKQESEAIAEVVQTEIDQDGIRRAYSSTNSNVFIKEEPVEEQMAPVKDETSLEEVNDSPVDLQTSSTAAAEGSSSNSGSNNRRFVKTSVSADTLNRIKTKNVTRNTKSLNPVVQSYTNATSSSTSLSNASSSESILGAEGVETFKLNESTETTQHNTTSSSLDVFNTAFMDKVPGGQTQNDVLIEEIQGTNNTGNNLELDRQEIENLKEVETGEGDDSKICSEDVRNTAYLDNLPAYNEYLKDEVEQDENKKVRTFAMDDDDTDDEEDHNTANIRVDDTEPKSSDSAYYGNNGDSNLLDTERSGIENHSEVANNDSMIGVDAAPLASTLISEDVDDMVGGHPTTIVNQSQNLKNDNTTTDINEECNGIINNNAAAVVEEDNGSYFDGRRSSRTTTADVYTPTVNSRDVVLKTSREEGSHHASIAESRTSHGGSFQDEEVGSTEVGDNRRRKPLQTFQLDANDSETDDEEEEDEDFVDANEKIAEQESNNNTSSFIGNVFSGIKSAITKQFSAGSSSSEDDSNLNGNLSRHSRRKNKKTTDEMSNLAVASGEMRDNEEELRKQKQRCDASRQKAAEMLARMTSGIAFVKASNHHSDEEAIHPVEEEVQVVKPTYVREGVTLDSENEAMDLLCNMVYMWLKTEVIGRCANQVSSQMDASALEPDDSLLDLVTVKLPESVRAVREEIVASRLLNSNNSQISNNNNSIRFVNLNEVLFQFCTQLVDSFYDDRSTTNTVEQGDNNVDGGAQNSMGVIREEDEDELSSSSGDDAGLNRSSRGGRNSKYIEPSHLPSRELTAIDLLDASNSAILLHLIEDYVMQLVDETFIHYVDKCYASSSDSENAAMYGKVWRETREKVLNLTTDINFVTSSKKINQKSNNKIERKAGSLMASAIRHEVLLLANCTNNDSKYREIQGHLWLNIPGEEYKELRSMVDMTENYIMQVLCSDKFPNWRNAISAANKKRNTSIVKAHEGTELEIHAIQNFLECKIKPVLYDTLAATQGADFANKNRTYAILISESIQRMIGLGEKATSPTDTDNLMGTLKEAHEIEESSKLIAEHVDDVLAGDQLPSGKKGSVVRRIDLTANDTKDFSEEGGETQARRKSSALSDSVAPSVVTVEVVNPLSLLQHENIHNSKGGRNPFHGIDKIANALVLDVVLCFLSKIGFISDRRLQKVSHRIEQMYVKEIVARVDFDDVDILLNEEGLGGDLDGSRNTFTNMEDSLKTKLSRCLEAKINRTNEVLENIAFYTLEKCFLETFSTAVPNSKKGFTTPLLKVKMYEFVKSVVSDPDLYPTDGFTISGKASTFLPKTQISKLLSIEQKNEISRELELHLNELSDGVFKALTVPKLSTKDDPTQDNINSTEEKENLLSAALHRSRVGASIVVIKNSCGEEITGTNNPASSCVTASDVEYLTDMWRKTHTETTCAGNRTRDKLLARLTESTNAILMEASSNSSEYDAGGVLSSSASSATSRRSMRGLDLADNTSTMKTGRYGLNPKLFRVQMKANENPHAPKLFNVGEAAVGDITPRERVEIFSATSNYGNSNSSSRAESFDLNNRPIIGGNTYFRHPGILATNSSSYLMPKQQNNLRETNSYGNNHDASAFSVNQHPTSTVKTATVVTTRRSRSTSPSGAAAKKRKSSSDISSRKISFEDERMRKHNKKSIISRAAAGAKAMALHDQMNNPSLTKDDDKPLTSIGAAQRSSSEPRSMSPNHIIELRAENAEALIHKTDNEILQSTDQATQLEGKQGQNTNMIHRHLSPPPTEFRSVFLGHEETIEVHRRLSELTAINSEDEVSSPCRKKQNEERKKEIHQVYYSPTAPRIPGSPAASSGGIIRGKKTYKEVVLEHPTTHMPNSDGKQRNASLDSDRGVRRESQDRRSPQPQQLASSPTRRVVIKAAAPLSPRMATNLSGSTNLPLPQIDIPIGAMKGRTKVRYRVRETGEEIDEKDLNLGPNQQANLIMTPRSNMNITTPTHHTNINTSARNSVMSFHTPRAYSNDINRRVVPFMMSTTGQQGYTTPTNYTTPHQRNGSLQLTPRTAGGFTSVGSVVGNNSLYGSRRESANSSAATTHNNNLGSSMMSPKVSRWGAASPVTRNNSLSSSRNSFGKPVKTSRALFASSEKLIEQKKKQTKANYEHFMQDFERKQLTRKLQAEEEEGVHGVVDLTLQPNNMQQPQHPLIVNTPSRTGGIMPMMMSPRVGGGPLHGENVTDKTLNRLNTHPNVAQRLADDFLISNPNEREKAQRLADDFLISHPNERPITQESTNIQQQQQQNCCIDTPTTSCLTEKYKNMYSGFKDIYKNMFNAAGQQQQSINHNVDQEATNNLGSHPPPQVNQMTNNLSTGVRHLTGPSQATNFFNLNTVSGAAGLSEPKGFDLKPITRGHLNTDDTSTIQNNINMTMPVQHHSNYGGGESIDAIDKPILKVHDLEPQQLDAVDLKNFIQKQNPFAKYYKNEQSSNQANNFTRPTAHSRGAASSSSSRGEAMANYYLGNSALRGENDTAASLIEEEIAKVEKIEEETTHLLEEIRAEKEHLIELSPARRNK